VYYIFKQLRCSRAVTVKTEWEHHDHYDVVDKKTATRNAFSIQVMCHPSEAEA